MESTVTVKYEKGEKTTEYRRDPRWVIRGLNGPESEQVINLQKGDRKSKGQILASVTVKLHERGLSLRRVSRNEFVAEEPTTVQTQLEQLSTPTA